MCTNINVSSQYPFLMALGKSTKCQFTFKNIAKIKIGLWKEFQELPCKL